LEDDKRTNYGQHFLIDYSSISKIIESCRVGKKDTVLEFGTGYGYLTREISKLAKVVYSFEIDKELYLKAKKYLFNIRNIKIFNQDFFSHDSFPFDFFLSNIPYSKSKEIIKWLSLQEFREGVIMVQKEFSEKLTAFPGNKKYSVVSVISQYCFDVEPLFEVSKDSFIPSPQIQSTVMRLKNKKRKMTGSIISNLEYLFSHRNKKVVSFLNNEQYDNKRIGQLDTDSLLRICNKLNDQLPDK
jgi:16S rRNA (adenine1518-N6/adenine1519-N6)-dimethyltransferase